jgi:hypothetical protein
MLDTKDRNAESKVKLAPPFTNYRNSHVLFD